MLNSNDVRYLLVGGHAVNYHGYPRATADLDVWVAVDPDNSRKLEKTLQDFGFDGAEAAMFEATGKVIRMGVPPLRIEILTSVSGVEFDECFLERETAEIEGVTVNLISLPRLKQNKRSAGRSKDFADLEQLD